MPLNIGCTARPGKARDNRTGSWRVFYPIYDKEKCTGCELCALICPEGVYRTLMKKTIALISTTARGAASAQKSVLEKRSIWRRRRNR